MVPYSFVAVILEPERNTKFSYVHYLTCILALHVPILPLFGLNSKFLHVTWYIHYIPILYLFYEDEFLYND